MAVAYRERFSMSDSGGFLAALSFAFLLPYEGPKAVTLLTNESNT